MALQSNNYTHITANGKVVITPQFCGLETVKINLAGANNNIITVTEGNPTKVIAVIDGTVAHKHDFDLANLDGIIVTVSGGTPGDITVIWQ